MCYATTKKHAKIIEIIAKKLGRQKPNMKNEKLSFKKHIAPLFKEHDELDAFFCVSLTNNDRGIFYAGEADVLEIANATIQWLTIVVKDTDIPEKGFIIDPDKENAAKKILAQALFDLEKLCTPYSKFRD